MTWGRLVTAAAAAGAGYLVGLVLVPRAVELYRRALEDPPAAGHVGGLVLAAAAALLVLVPSRGRRR